MARPPLPYGLYALTDPELLPEPVLAERVAAAIAGGAGVVQFRDKTATGATLRRRARAVLDACRAGGALCIINDDAALAAELDADGVHLGRDDGDPAAARAIVGPDRLIGVSCYDRPELARAAVAAGADYVAFGSVWPSETKPGAVRASLALLRDAARELPVPVVAIGGITRDNAAETMATGAHCVAVVRDLFGDPAPRAAAQVLSAACRRGAKMTVFAGRPSAARPAPGGSHIVNLFQEAQRYIPGGVNSPVRAFRSVGGDPVFVRRAAGAYFWGEDGRRYIDYVGSWGPMILGHAHPDVIEAVRSAALDGLSFGAPTAIETELARRVCTIMPSIELVRFVSSGTEATMSAIRLARGFTGRDKIVKFEGCYHGHSDSLLVKAGSGALTLGVPTSPGVPASLAQHTITLSYNNLAEVDQVFAEIGDEIACIIVEPIAGNMNMVLPAPGFLEGLRAACDRHGALLIFDEVMTGFRVALGGVQALSGVRPDLTTLGKIIGGGMPVGAFGGRREVMEQIAPLGPVYQAGTLSGNPVAMHAGIATLDRLNPALYEELGARTGRLVAGVQAAADAAGIPFCGHSVGGMFGMFFSGDGPIRSFAQVMACDQARFKAFFHGMLDEGVYLAPSAFEAGFVSLAHTDEDVDATVAAARTVMATL